MVAETTVGDVRGEEGFYHYRQYSAVELAARRSLEDVWYLLVDGELPDAAQAAAFGAQVASPANAPRGAGLRSSPNWPGRAPPSTCLRTAVSLLGAELGWAPTLDVDRADPAAPGAAAVRRRADHPHRRAPAPDGPEADRPAG